MNGDYTKVELDDQPGSPEGSREVAPEPSPAESTPGQENRDPEGMNQHLKVDFEQVIGEPSSAHSFDRVWAWSNVSFEVCKLWGYRIVSLLCAVPSSIGAGCLFALVTCLHIWCLVPGVRMCLLSRPTWQSCCRSLTDAIVAPICTSLGRCFRRVHLQLARP
ncbi:caveolin-2 [Pristis pectinata]|uniref:caveolin-2 n=1 Tax=Pristis pectinata TaxID=685728 RepID=UPI00223D9830|nr:caveolin-2 [Pristis pectinata]